MSSSIRLLDPYARTWTLIQPTHLDPEDRGSTSLRNLDSTTQIYTDKAANTQG
jgi:hypothetical protein